MVFLLQQCPGVDHETDVFWIFSCECIGDRKRVQKFDLIKCKKGLPKSFGWKCLYARGIENYLPRWNFRSGVTMICSPVFWAEIPVVAFSILPNTQLYTYVKVLLSSFYLDISIEKERWSRKLIHPILHQCSCPPFLSLNLENNFCRLC
jgi:hypothetical protein